MPPELLTRIKRLERAAPLLNADAARTQRRQYGEEIIDKFVKGQHTYSRDPESIAGDSSEDGSASGGASGSSCGSISGSSSGSMSGHVTRGRVVQHHGSASGSASGSPSGDMSKFAEAVAQILRGHVEKAPQAARRRSF